MKNIKVLAAIFAVFAIGSITFAATAAENYLSQFETLVTNAESYAKNSDGTKLSAIETQKAAIDALRQTVTLSVTQRFKDWRLTKRYDAAHTKIKGYASSTEVKEQASEKVSETTSAIGSAVDKAAENVGSVLKEGKDQAVTSVKKAGEEAVDNVKTKAKETVEGKVEDATKTVSDKIQAGTESVVNKINGILNGGNSSSED